MKIKPSYMIFIDESGEKEYINLYNQNSFSYPEAFNKDFWRKNYFVMAALVIKYKDVIIINHSILEQKIKSFGISQVEIKSSWLRNSYQRNKQYIDKFSISEEHLNQFVLKVYEIFTLYQERIQLIAVVFDKQFYRNRRKHNPFCETTHVLFEKIQFLMERCKGTAILISDQMEDSLSPIRGRHGEIIDVLLKTRVMEPCFVNAFTRIKDIEFRSSTADNLLQLVDLVAYNVFRQFVDYGRKWEDKKNPGLPVYKYLGFHLGNFINKRGRVQGVGISKLPDIGKIHWGI
ncbi:MAG: DUF3800 domain-containing protein [Actinobacteria bacterium]|nr:DUF3800 domain-containing protein [Actinomycetota bacterium]